MGIRSIVKNAWVWKENRAYEKALGKQKLTYTRWVELDETEKRAPEDKGGTDYVIWKKSGVTLSKEASAQISAFFAADFRVQILYGDEDVKQENGERRSPFIKPCWSPDTYLSYFYVGSVVAVRRELLEKAGISPESTVVEYGETEQIRPLMDKLFALAGGFEKGCRSIARVPYVLCHVAEEAQWESHFRSPATISEEGGKSPGISVIIPSKDNPKVLGQCLNALQKMSRDLEIIVVDNGSSPENKQAVEALTRGMKYIYKPMVFNFSAMCNIGAEQATGDMLLFLNDDIEVVGSDWLEAMSRRAAKPYAGAVGLKLYYPGGDNIQHAGVVNLPIGPDHKLHGKSDSREYYFGWNRYHRNCLAVTGACLLVETVKFWEVGGFRTDLAVNYNDVELCFRLYEQGYQNVVINDYYAYHHESLSRGSNVSPEKMKALVREREYLYRLHPGIGVTDPYFPEELDRRGLNVEIQPAYICGIRHLQPSCWQSVQMPGNARYDRCVMVRVELCNEKALLGYGMVLGDNNACYNRYLLLGPAEGNEEVLTGDCLCMKADGVYRYELEQSVPDQVNVALGGFYISIEKPDIPKGRYRIGMLAEHKLSKGKLFCWSGSELTI